LAAAEQELHQGVGGDAAHIDARRVYILPTRYGVLFGGALLLMLLVSVNYNNGLGHLFTFLLVGVALVAMHYTQRNLVGLDVSVAPGRPVFAGDTADANIAVTDRLNRARRAVWLRGGGGETPVNVARGGRSRVTLPYRTTQRGLHPLPDVALLTVYPIGLFCAWTRSLRNPASQLVYPKPAPAATLPETGRGTMFENGVSARRGEADFNGLRDHVREDPLSRIHWRASARGAGLKTKLFSGEGRGELALRWSDAPGGDTESRLGVMCRWVLDAERSGLRYSLELPGSHIEYGCGAQHQQRCLRALALWREPAAS
jgi:uncharacterized protein (DUF58 family)